MRPIAWRELHTLHVDKFKNCNIFKLVGLKDYLNKLFYYIFIISVLRYLSDLNIYIYVYFILTWYTVIL